MADVFIDYLVLSGPLVFPEGILLRHLWLPEEKNVTEISQTKNTANHPLQSVRVKCSQILVQNVIFLKIHEESCE